MSLELPRDAERRAERHVMVDLETLGKAAGCVPFAIGAVPFDPHAGTLGKPFFILVNPLDAMRHGLGVAPDTLKFWKDEASPAARAYLDASYEEGLPLEAALGHFARYLEAEVGPKDTLRLWGKGADFDKPILDAAYAVSSLDLPWGPRAARCYRSLEAFMSEMPPRRTLTGTEHHAVDDAIHQATQSIHALREIYHLPPLPHPILPPPVSEWVTDPLVPVTPVPAPEVPHRSRRRQP